MKQFEVLQWAFSFLKKHRREERVAEILLQYLMKQDSATFYLNMREPLKESDVSAFKKMIKRHAKTGIPVEHLTGEAHFYGRQFFVNEHVLIPRFETEEVIDYVIQKVRHLSFDAPPIIVDVGTGSGVIAITLALELVGATVYATDISESALTVAKQNAEKLGANVQFFHGDFLKPIIERNIAPHFIISNPPYIAEHERDSLTDTVLNYDPHLALFAANNGLEAYEMIFKQAQQLTVESLRGIFLEIGHQQGKAVANLMQETFSKDEVKIIKDINGKDRIVSMILS